MNLSTVVRAAEAAHAEFQVQETLMPEPRPLSPAEVLAVAGGPEVTNGGD